MKLSDRETTNKVTAASLNLIHLQHSKEFVSKKIQVPRQGFSFLLDLL